MENSNLGHKIGTQEPLSQGWKFPSTHDTNVVVAKLQNPHNPLGASAWVAKVDVTFIGMDMPAMSHSWENQAEKTCKDDCAKLRAMALRKKYKAEAKCHSKMLERAETHGRTIHHQFRKFRDFLAAVGPQPCAGATIDRIDNNDPEYAPGKVRWADKRTQSNNRSSTLLFQSSDGGKITATQLAHLQAVCPSTIRKRLERGWTDAEIVFGKRSISLKLPPAPQPPVTGHAKSHHLSPAVPRTRSSAPEHLWRQREETVAHVREEEGQEYCLCDLEELNKGLPDGCPAVTPEQYERRFMEWWRDYKPHLHFPNLPGWARALIEKHDGAQVMPVQDDL